jgi:hypothetical protein
MWTAVPPNNLREQKDTQKKRGKRLLDSKMTDMMVVVVCVQSYILYMCTTFY